MGSSRILDDIQPGDWLCLNVAGATRLEQVESATSFVVKTKYYRFTRYGRQWPNASAVTARPASDENVRSWLENPPEQPRLTRKPRRR